MRKKLSIHPLLIFTIIILIVAQVSPILNATSFISYESSATGASEYDYVDLDTSNVDNSNPAYKGTHSNFTSQKYYDSIYDTLTEGGSEVVVNNAENFVNNNSSNIDGSDPANKGSHGNFTAQRYQDPFCDTLTEQNTGGVGNWGITSSSFTVTATHTEYRYMGGTSPNIENMKVTKLHIRYSGAGTMAIALYTGGSLTNPTGASKKTEAYNVTLSAGWNVIDVPDYNWPKNTVTWIGWCHAGGSVYCSSSSADAGNFQSARGRWSQTTPSDADETSPMPTNPGSGSFSNYWYAVYVEYEVINYELDLEVQWINLDYNKTNEYLCIRTGSTDWGSEDIRVDVWTGSWTNIILDLAPDTWNNISISTYLTSPTLTIRFKGGTESKDANKDSWDIECSLVHVWSSETNYELDLEIQWTDVNYTRANEELCIKTGTIDAEDIKVYVWNAASLSWHLIFDDLSAGNWNNASVVDYLTSNTFTVRFLGGTETNDISQDSWQIDCALLHTWTPTESAHASFTYTPLVPYVNDTVTFDASASTSDYGYIISFEWYFGDSTSGTGTVVNKVYKAAGNYTVTLNVTDSEGAKDTKSKSIMVVVRPEDPVIDLYNQKGGQGPNEPSENFAPRETVFFTALVTYHGEPVEYKLVGFEVKNAVGETVLERTSMTDANGLAKINFTILGECLPEIFGTWTALAIVSVVEQTVNDTLTFQVRGPLLDVYTQKPEPYSGKGFDQPSDAFAPQEEVILYGEVHYDCEPIEGKLVAFEVTDPTGKRIIYRSNITNEHGIATTSFRLASNATFGKYNVFATVEVLAINTNDTLAFQVGWIIEILMIQTVDQNGNSQTVFKRGEQMYFNVTIHSISFTSKMATLTIVVYDECGVPIGQVTLQHLSVPPETSTIFIIGLPIPKWAFLGVGNIYVNAYTDLPQSGGTPYCPEISTTFMIVKP
jgi:PKD repeat protein